MPLRIVNEHTSILTGPNPKSDWKPKSSRKAKLHLKMHTIIARVPLK